MRLPAAADLVRSHPRLAVAFSGGVDSAALLHAVTQAGGDVLAVHIDHGLHPRSAEIADHCAQYCAEIGVPFVGRAIEVSRRGSVEAAARSGRYAALAAVALGEGRTVVATAHHADDAIETALLDRTRGRASAAAALRAELSIDGLTVVRPLLRTRRATLVQYAAAHDIAIAEDPTNADLSFERNRIRSLLGQLSPAELSRWYDAFEQAASASTELEANAREWLTKCVVQRGPTSRRLRLSNAEPEIISFAIEVVADQLGGFFSAPVLAETVAQIMTKSTWRGCATRIAVETDAQWLRLTRTTGQGFRHLDASRTTTEAKITGTGRLPWYGGSIDYDVGDRRLAIRNVAPKARLLQRLGVPRWDRWWWPSVWEGQSHLGACPNRSESRWVDGDLFVEFSLRVDTSP